jgi:hypothetical protein
VAIGPTCCSVSRCTRAAGYRFGTNARCRRHALTYQPVVRRAIVVALFVGTILCIINQADVLLSGHLTAFVVAKIGLTYLVPFSVSTYSALAANRV